MKKLWKNHRGKLLVLAIVSLILFVNLPYTKAFYKSTFLLLELAPSSRLKPLGIFSKEPILKEVVYKSGEGEIFADLYIPNDSGKHPAAVLHLGLDIDRKDPRVTLLAEALSRSGIIILAPNLPTISNRRLTFDTPTEFRDSFNYLYSLDQVNQSKTGFMAFCAAGSPALIASQKHLKNKVDFLITINPYYDLPTFLSEITSRKVDGKDWIPHHKTVEVFNRETVFLVQDKEDKELLSKTLIDIVPEDLEKGNFEKINAQSAFNSDEAVNTYLGLTNEDPQKTKNYINNSNSAQKNYLRDLSASAFVKDFKPKTFILSEKPNHYIPYTQAQAFHHNLEGSNFEEVDYTVTEPGPKIGIKDGLKSLVFLWRIFSYTNP